MINLPEREYVTINRKAKRIMTTQSRLELVLELENKLRAGFSQAKKQIDTEMRTMQKKVDTISTTSDKSLGKVNGNLSNTKKGLASLLKPSAFVVAGIGLIGTTLAESISRANDFNLEFQKLENLNLSKTKKEINDLRRLVMDTSWSKGFNAEKTIQAYYDVQTNSKLYGRDARGIVEQQGEFANRMRADMNEWVKGTTKAMENWHFGVDKLTEFNRSAFAVNQNGISYDALMKSQSVFGGSAVSAKQDFDTANKLLSVFSVRAKSVDTASTQVKSLFDNLTKKSTIDAFRKIGISIYDTNGRIKQADSLMLELNKKFRQAKDDKAFVSIRNQFSGSQGLLAMLQAATDHTGNLKKAFDDFNSSKMNFDTAFSNAQNDILYRQEKLSNRIDNLMIRLGQIALPLKESVVGVAEKMVSNFDFYNLKTPVQRSERMTKTAEDRYRSQYSKFFKDLDTITEEELQRRQRALLDIANESRDRYDKMTNEYSNKGFWDHLTGKNTFSGLFGNRDAKLDDYDRRNSYLRQNALGQSNAARSLANELGVKWYNRDTSKVTDSFSDSNKTDDASGSSGLSDTLNRVVGTAQAPRNITINIDAFNKGGINTENTTLKNMSPEEIEAWFTDVCMRVVRNVETSY